MSVGEFLLYTTENGVARQEVRLVDETALPAGTRRGRK